MTAATTPTRIIIATPPIFMNRIEAGKYLGHSEEWLRVQALRHDLYKPSTGLSRQGSPCKYHIEHLNIIARHMLCPDTFDEDTALLVWCRLKTNSIQDLIDSAKTRKGSKQ